MGEDTKRIEVLCSDILMKWGFREKFGTSCIDSELYHKESFIYNVIVKRIQAFGIPVQVPDELSLIIELCTDSNPGKSLILLYELMESIAPISSGYVITSEDFVKVHAVQYPIMANEEIDTKYEHMWDSQKRVKGGRSYNLIDTRDYWMQLFK